MTSQILPRLLGSVQLGRAEAGFAGVVERVTGDRYELWRRAFCTYPGPRANPDR